MGRLRRAAMWSCVIVLAAVFVLVGASKLSGPSAIRWSERFDHWGFPRPVRPVVGGLEILGGIGLLAAKSRRAAAATLTFLMVGALFTHLVNAEPFRLVPPLILGGMALLVLSWSADRPST